MSGVVKIRLTGTRGECDHLVGALRQLPGVAVVEVSAFYPNRGASDLGRVYVETRPQPEHGPPSGPAPDREP